MKNTNTRRYYLLNWCRVSSWSQHSDFQPKKKKSKKEKPKNRNQKTLEIIDSDITRRVARIDTVQSEV